MREAPEPVRLPLLVAVSRSEAWGGREGGRRVADPSWDREGSTWKREAVWVAAGSLRCGGSRPQAAGGMRESRAWKPALEVCSSLVLPSWKLCRGSGLSRRLPRDALYPWREGRRVCCARSVAVTVAVERE